MSRYVHDEVYYIAKLNRNDTSIGLDSAVPSSPPRRASSTPVGLGGSTSFSRRSRHRYISTIGLDDAVKSSPSRETAAHPSNPHLCSKAEPIGLSAAVRQHNIGQRPFGPYVCKEWKKCWFCTEYVQPPKHQPPKHEQVKGEREENSRERREGSKHERRLEKQREAGEAVLKQGKKEKPKKSWIQRQLRDFKVAAKNMRGGGDH
jgi:hypothetical protein